MLVVEGVDAPVRRHRLRCTALPVRTPDGQRQVEVVRHVAPAHAEQRQAGLGAALHAGQHLQCGPERFAQVQAFCHAAEIPRVALVVVREVTA